MTDVTRVGRRLHLTIQATRIAVGLEIVSLCQMCAQVKSTTSINTRFADCSFSCVSDVALLAIRLDTLATLESYTCCYVTKFTKCFRAYWDPWRMSCTSSQFPAWVLDLDKAAVACMHKDLGARRYPTLQHRPCYLFKVNCLPHSGNSKKSTCHEVSVGGRRRSNDNEVLALDPTKGRYYILKP